MALFASVIGTATAANAVVYPYVHITSPGATSTTAGTTAIQVSGAVDPNGSDTILDFGLLIDGSEYGGAVYCPTPNSKACSAQLLWNATTPDGSATVHSVQVEMVRTGYATTLSAPVSVTVMHPTASPVISAPTEGATVLAGDVFVDADVSFATPSYGETVYIFSLYVDGTRVDYELCDQSISTTSCPMEFYWDAGGAASGPHALEVRLVTGSGATWDSPDLHVTVVVPPVVTITSPVPNASVRGPVTVVATGSVDGSSGDTPQAMALFIDNSQVGPDEICPATAPTCTLSFPWDTNGLPGSHIVNVRFETDQFVVFSEPTAVRVTVPPTVTIALPGDPTNWVNGFTQVTLTGTIDPSVLDTPSNLQLYVNGQPSGAAKTCYPFGRTCTATFPWNTSSLDGARGVSLSGRFTTAHDTALSAVRLVNVGIDHSTPGNSRVVVFGTRVNGVDYAQVRTWDQHSNPLFGVPVTVRVQPATGPEYTVTGTTTSPNGEVLLPLRGPQVNRVLTASLGVDYGSATTRPAKFTVQALSFCRLPKKVTHGRTTQVACKGSRVAAGTKVTLYFKYPHAGVHVLAHARFNAKGHATITFVSRVRKETVQLWAEVSSSALYVGTGSFPVLVRMI